MGVPDLMGCYASILEEVFPGGYVGVPGIRCAGGQRVVVGLDAQVAWYWPGSGLLYRPGSDVFEESAARGELYPDLLDEGTLLLLLLELSYRHGLLPSSGGSALGVTWSPKLSPRLGGRRPEVVCWVLRVAGHVSERRFSGESLSGVSDPVGAMLAAFLAGGAGSRTRVRVR